MDSGSIKAQGCLTFLQRVEIAGYVNELELVNHLDSMASLVVIEFLVSFKPKNVKKALMECNGALLTSEQLGGLIATLLAYDDIDAMKRLIQIL